MYSKLTALSEGNKHYFTVRPGLQTSLGHGKNYIKREFVHVVVEFVRHVKT